MSSNPSNSSSTGNVTITAATAGDDDDLRSMNMTIQLTITGAPGAPRVPFPLSTTTTAAVGSSSDGGGNTGTTTTTTITSTEFRRQVSVATHIPISNLRLIYRGRLIVDNDKNDVAVDFKLEEGSVLHCMGKPETTPVNSSATSGTVHGVGSLPAAANDAVEVSESSAPPVATASSASQPPLHTIQSALNQMRTSNTPAVFLTGVTTLDKILSNIISHPLEEKYRTLKISNPTFQRRLGGISGGDSAIRACGFIVIHEHTENAAYSMTPSPEQWPELLQSKTTIEQAVRQAAMSTSASSAAVVGTTTTTAASNTQAPGGSLFPFGNNNMVVPPSAMLNDSPELRRAVAETLSNPQQLQAMFQVRLYTRIYFLYKN
jgi:PUB domain/Ubiquitin family